jgi:hypothetical protein
MRKFWVSLLPKLETPIRREVEKLSLSTVWRLISDNRLSVGIPPVLTLSCSQSLLSAFCSLSLVSSSSFSNHPPQHTIILHDTPFFILLCINPNETLQSISTTSQHSIAALKHVLTLNLISINSWLTNTSFPFPSSLSPYHNSSLPSKSTS